MQKNNFIDIDLSDAELLSYYYDNNKNNLLVKVKCWNDHVLSLNFIELIRFVDNGTGDLTALCHLEKQNPMLLEVLKDEYETGNIPTEHPYNYYFFVDLDDRPVMQIVCREYEVIKS